MGARAPGTGAAGGGRVTGAEGAGSQGLVDLDVLHREIPGRRRGTPDAASRTWRTPWRSSTVDARLLARVRGGSRSPPPSTHSGRRRRAVLSAPAAPRSEHSRRAGGAASLRRVALATVERVAGVEADDQLERDCPPCRPLKNASALSTSPTRARGGFRRCGAVAGARRSSTAQELKNPSAGAAALVTGGTQIRLDARTPKGGRRGSIKATNEGCRWALQRVAGHGRDGAVVGEQAAPSAPHQVAERIRPGRR